MANPGTELASLDFGNLIGSPLVAVITAQSIAARSTADFIKTVGFDADDNLIYVDFKYPKEISPYQPAVTGVAGVAGVTGAGNSSYLTGMKGTGYSVGIENDGTNLVGYPPYVKAVTAVTAVTAVAAKDAVYQEMKFAVPILTMLPIPFIKIDKFTMDFNAKITSMETASQSTDTSISGNLEVRQRWPSGSAKLSVNAAYKKSTASSSSIERTYSMAIHVEASQDEMPAGMEKLLNILEGAMKSEPGKLIKP
jgi:hypothetical protein